MPTGGRRIAWLSEADSSVGDDEDLSADDVPQEQTGCCCRVCVSIIVGEPAFTPPTVPFTHASLMTVRSSCTAASWFAILLALSTLSFYAAPFRFPPTADGTLGAVDDSMTTAVFISAPCGFLLATCCLCCWICCCCSSHGKNDADLSTEDGRHSKLVRIVARMSKQMPQDSRAQRFSRSFAHRVTRFESAFSRGSSSMQRDSSRRLPGRLSARSARVQDDMATSRGLDTTARRAQAAKYSVAQPSVSAPSHEPDERSPVRRMSVEDVRRIATS